MALASRIAGRMVANMVRNPQHWCNPVCRSLASIQQCGSYLRLKRDESDSQPLELSYFWLRDQCRCKECYEYSTHQRLKHITELPLDITPTSVDFSDTSADLHITWPDNHTSFFSGDWLKLLRSSSKGPVYSKPDIVPWSGEEMHSMGIPTISFDAIQQHYGSHVPAILFDNVLRHGLCRIENVPMDIQVIKDLAARIAVAEDSYYGQWWRIAADVKGVTDLGYGNVPLYVHTDGTHFQQTWGYMLMYCELAAENGGESLYVDGIKAAYELRETKPAHYEALKRVWIPHESVEKELHFKAYKRTIELEPDGDTIRQICFNPYDRAEMPPFESAAEQHQFYEAYQEFAKLLQRPSSFYEILLKPGNILVYDNFRVLHGRRGFTGRRILGGCYMSRDDFLSRARHLRCLQSKPSANA